MNVFSHQLLNLRVIALQTAQVVAHLDDPIIEPSSLKINAFYCQDGNRKSKKIVLARDVVKINQLGVIVDSSEDILELSDVIRIKDLANKHFHLKLLSVITESGEKLGKVEDYTIDLSILQVQKLYIKPSLLKSILLQRLIIDRTQIVEVTHKNIVVRDNRVKKTTPIPEPIVR